MLGMRLTPCCCVQRKMVVLLMSMLTTSWTRVSASIGCNALCHQMLWIMQQLRPRQPCVCINKSQRTAMLLPLQLTLSPAFRCLVMCVVQQAPTSSSKLKGESFCQRAAEAKLAQSLPLQGRQQATALQAAKHLQSKKRIRFPAGECHACLNAHTFCVLARHMTSFVLCCFGTACNY